MKKSLLITGLLVLSLGASMAFAAENDQSKQSTMPMGQMMNWDQMKEYHKQMIDQAIKDGRMTAEQAKAMDERMNKHAGHDEKHGSWYDGGHDGPRNDGC